MFLRFITNFPFFTSNEQKKKQEDKAKQPQKKIVRRISSSPNAVPKQIKH
ncbi:unnamed protein product [Brassica rapa subsp. trilocularis]